ncbi:pathogenicity island protein [Staphylococcus chromogenes]|uniref:pathogenicity island protein n=1 Tax=Staphylococcus chromogenes TaxID=46126 RepID=UPI003D7A4E39
MNNLTKKDYKEIDKKLSYDKNFEDEKQNKKMLELLEKRRDREASVIKGEYPQLSDNEISEILVDYREYKDLISAIEVFRDFPTNYAEPNLNRFLTEDDIEDLKGAVEEMAYYVEIMEDKA